MKRCSFPIAFLLAIMALFFSSCANMSAKKPALKNTRWVCVQQMFVADAGTMTETYTLTFTSGKDCLWKQEWVLPAHPAMYMNPDGTVDRIPESRSESVSQATWKFSRNTITLQFEDGTRKTFLYEKGRLTGASPFGGEMVFEQRTEDTQ